MENYIMPRRIVEAIDALNINMIFEERESQMTFFPDEKIEETCVLIKKGGYILIDFGKELCGGIELGVRATANEEEPAKCRLVFGESVMEALSTIGEKNATNNHSIRDMVIDATLMSVQRYGATGFRFVRIEAIEADIYIKTVKAINDIEGFEYKGDFECNDALLNEIWKAGAYTAELNTHDYIWDGVKRDRLVWIGDMHPEISIINAVFGDVPAIKNSLDYVKAGTPSTVWMNKTATYSMWWIIIHHDYYMHYGDKKYLAEQEAYLMPLCDNIFKWADEDFAGSQYEMMGFVDWSSKYTESEFEGRRAVACLAIICAEKIFDVLNNSEYTEKCSEYKKRLQAEKVDIKTNKSIAALTVLSGRDTTYAKDIISGCSADDLSCFMGYYVLKAKAKLGQYAESLEVIRKYWGGMLSVGSTTFWEDFDIDWLENSAGIDEITPEGMNSIHGDFGRCCYENFRLSLCHGWAGGPTPYLMEQIGGVEILEPGCKKVRISPNLGDLEWIKVNYPTPYGVIKLYAKKENGEVTITVDAPQAIEIVY